MLSQVETFHRLTKDLLRFLVIFSVHIERGISIIYCCGLNKVFHLKIPRRLPNMITCGWYNGRNTVNITNKMSIMITIAHFKTFSIKKSFAPTWNVGDPETYKRNPHYHTKGQLHLKKVMVC